MKSFFVGLVLGFAAITLAAKIVGSGGYFFGWDISYKGERICSDPYI